MWDFKVLISQFKGSKLWGLGGGGAKLLQLGPNFTIFEEFQG